MKFTNRFFILYPLSFILFCTSCTLRQSVHSHTSSQVFKDIDEILDDSLLQKGTTGIEIISASSGKILYERNSSKYFSPASNMKLITTVGALFLLKAEYRFQTYMMTNGTMREDTLKGDIILYGKGDPTLRLEHLDRFAEYLRFKGISVIDGDIAFDDSYFDTIPYGPGWMWDDLPYPFSAPVSALSVNGNIITVYVTPGRVKDDSLQVRIVPGTSCVVINNKGITGLTDDLSVSVDYTEGKHRVTVKGSHSTKTGRKKFIRTIQKPAQFTTDIFFEKLIEEGISITGTVTERKIEDSFDTLGVHDSEPLLKVLYDLDKYSSNFIAEHVLKSIGAEEYGSPGSFSKGIQAIESIITKQKIVESKIVQKDGSGLSRYNLISPKQISSLLFFMLHKFEFAPEFLTVFPIGGIDGTLQKRLDADILERRVRAKTGTMSNVSTLSGYCLTQSGNILIFSIMMEDHTVSTSYMRNIQDSILKKLIENY